MSAASQTQVASQAPGTASPSLGSEANPLVIAVVGNPNTGKTTLFNALTGLHQRTGNYAGVTVDSALGHCTHGDKHMLLVDLPGSYSLSPRAPDEVVAVRALMGSGDSARPHAALCIVDATNLDRNLFLLTQVIDSGLPVVACLSMVDIAKREGIRIDYRELESRLGIPVVPVHAAKRQGITQLKAALVTAVTSTGSEANRVPMPAAIEAEIETLAEILNGNSLRSRFMAQRLILDRQGFLCCDEHTEIPAAAATAAAEARERLKAQGLPLPSAVIDCRYAWIQRLVADTVVQPGGTRFEWTKRIDEIVTHKGWGLLIFLTGMGFVFQAIFSWAAPFMDMIDAAFSALARTVGAVLPAGALRSLIVDGIIGGAGAVIVFVPQIAILFALITIMEDSGYMARAAFLMDRIMSSFGLSGRSFIPLLSSFACAVPGIMSARSIENSRDRLATILIAPLMSCSARLPVYVLFISAFIPASHFAGFIGTQGLTLFAMYGLGIAVAPLVALLLKKTRLKGPAVPFLLELPPYKVPSWRVVIYRVYDRSWAFVRRAGTIILATTIAIWVLSYFPTQPELRARYAAERVLIDDQRTLARLNAAEAAEHLRGSFLGRAGIAIEPLVKPLGWDWRIGMATLASFPAREVVIAALGTIYSLGDGHDESSIELRETLRAATWPDGRPIFGVAVALSIMVFFALCSQCAATLATMRRETGSWRAPLFAFGYMTTLAYVAALIVYQSSRAIFG